MKKVAILGSTGYVGEELVRLLYNHPKVELVKLSSHSYVGRPYAEVYPHFNQMISEVCVDDDLTHMDVDVLFVALPHGHASKWITPELLAKTKVIDLGADFRLSKKAYDKWYAVDHEGEGLLEEAVYGLTEWNREQVREAQLIANPGCYVTCSLLTLLPLVKEGFINPKTLIIDAKSGVTGAGRGLNLGTHFTECNESIKAYNVTTHRHKPEIDEQLAAIGGKASQVIFTPHLVPMNRGILTTIYADLLQPVDETDLVAIYNKYYGHEQFVRILGSTQIAETRWVKGSNYCDISFKIDADTGRLICVSAIDNMMKGAAGQAVQNMNVMMGWEEQTGINMPPLFPC